MCIKVRIGWKHDSLEDKYFLFIMGEGGREISITHRVYISRISVLSLSRAQQTMLKRVSSLGLCIDAFYTHELWKRAYAKELKGGNKSSNKTPE